MDRVALDAAIESARAQGETMGGPFAPGMPLTPYDGVSGLPRAWNFPTGYNIKARADRDGRMDFALLKAMRDSYDIAMMCINHRIDDVRSLPYTIRSADWVTLDNPQEIDQAKAAMKRPDGITPFRSWLAKFLRDVLSYDAGTLYRRRTLDGRACGLEVISGTTIAPVQDYHGRLPMPPAPAYVQFISGQPWEWLTTDDIIYVPFNPQSDSPYGMSPLEMVLLSANTDLRFQKHYLDYFTEGNIPEGFASAPEAMSTPEMLEKWQAYWEAMNTDSRVKHKLKMVPHGTVFDFPADKKFDPTFPMYLMRKTCAAFHVTPNDLGFTEDVNRATGDTQVDVQFRIGTLPLVQHVQDILTSYLQDDLGLAVVFEFDTGQEKEDRVATAQADQIYIQNAVVSPDEVRERVYGLATDAERPTPRYIFSTRQGPIPLRSLLDIAGPIDPETAAPSDLVPLDTSTYSGAPGVLPDKAPGAPQFEKAPTDPDDPRHPETEIPVPGSGIVGAPPAAPAPAPAVAKSLDGVTVSGVAVKAADTGRVLMIQRTLDPTDDAAGTWEFPGGHLEDGETAYDAATREWSEETGLRFPTDAEYVGGWSSPDGHYAGHVVKVPAEFPIVGADGEDSEALAWFHPDDLPGFPALRPALAETLPSEELAKAITRELSQWRQNTVTRLSRGQSPRPFEPTAMDDDLVEAVWKELRFTTNRAQVDAVFDQIRKARNRKRVRTTPNPKYTPLDPKAPAAPSGKTAGAASVGQTELDNLEDVELGDMGAIDTSTDQTDAEAEDEELTYGETHPAKAAPTVRSEADQPTPQQMIDKRLAEHWGPILLGALGSVLTEEQMSKVAESAIQSFQAGQQNNDERRMIERGIAFSAVKSTVMNLWNAAYSVGSLAANVSLFGPDDPRAAANLGVGPSAVASLWSKWTPETVMPAPAATDLGWRSIIAGKDSWFRDLKDTTLDQIGSVLDQGVKAGLSVDDLAKQINASINNPSRAHMIAQTESARMLTTASMAQYKAMGLRKYDLVISDGACDECVSIAQGNPYDIYDASALVPVHPRCRCSVAPTVDDINALNPAGPVDAGAAADSNADADMEAANV